MLTCFANLFLLMSSWLDRSDFLSETGKVG